MTIKNLPMLHSGVCAICDKVFDTDHPRSKTNTFDGKPVSDDCYWGAIGDVVEQRPVCNPTRRPA